MTRSFLISAVLITGLISCKNNTAHRPDNAFIYVLKNNAVIFDGKDTITQPVAPGFKTNDLIRTDNDSLGRITQIDSVKKIRYIILPVPAYYITISAKHPDIFNAYCSGDTLILCYTDTFHFYRPKPDTFEDSKSARVIDPETGEVFSWKVKNTSAIGDSIYGYTIIALAPFIAPLAIDLPEEIQEISSDSTHPDLVQVNQYNPLVTLQLGFYHPQK